MGEVTALTFLVYGICDKALFTLLEIENSLGRAACGVAIRIAVAVINCILKNYGIPAVEKVWKYQQLRMFDF